MILARLTNHQNLEQYLHKNGTQITQVYIMIERKSRTLDINICLGKYILIYPKSQMTNMIYIYSEVFPKNVQLS